MTTRGGRTPRRGWTVIVVPPRPGAPTRQLTLSTRTLAGTGLIALAAIGGAATWTGETSSLASARASRLVESQHTVITLRDSIESLHLAAVRDSQLPPRGMMMPVVGEMTSAFTTSRLHPLLRIFRAHLGVDLSAPVGTHIIAPANARVRSVGWRFAYGLTIELEHTGDVVTRYAHCRTSLVRAGDQVLAGETIGLVGTSGLSTGPHVHFEVLVHGTQVDPITFLAATRDAAGAERTHGGQDR